MFFCPPSVASGSPLSPPASRPSARSPASFKAFLSWARPELGLPALVPSCPAPPLPEAPSSSCARKELSSCASHLPDPGSADPWDYRPRECRRSREPSCPVWPQRTPPAGCCRGRPRFLVPCVVSLCFSVWDVAPAERVVRVPGRTAQSQREGPVVTSERSRERSPGRSRLPLNKPRVQKCSLSCMGPPSRPLLQEPQVKSEVLTDSPAGLQNLPAAAPGPCRGSAFPDGLPALRAALALLREGEGGGSQPQGLKG